MNVFRSAIRDTDGEVDAGYLALFWTMVVILNAIPLLCVASLIAMYFDEKHVFHAQELGVAIGAVCGGFGVAIGAVGAFRLGDKPRPTIITPAGDNIAQQNVLTDAPDAVVKKRGK